MNEYLKEISSIPLLSSDEESALGKRLLKGDPSARELLIKHNLRYVVEVAKSYQGQGLPLEELIQEGNLGICKAADKFNPKRGVKFISYAVWWIRQSILKSLSDKTRMVRIPINRINDYRKERKEQEKMEQEQGIEMPSDNLIYNSRHVSLTEDMFESRPLVETFPDENSIIPGEELENESFKIDMKDAFSILTNREIDILKYYHGIDEHRSFTLEEIGNILGLTRERIRQIKKKALEKINTNNKSKTILEQYK
jgi:RNA polymerase primary sigma factor